MIYLDNHEMTRPCSPAIERMAPFLEELWASPSSPHRAGQEVLASLDTRYQIIYDLVGAEPADTFVFTSSGAEATNQALWSVYLEKARKEGKCHIVTTPLEDAPTLQMLRRLEELGCFVKIAPLDGEGRVNVSELSALINPRTALVTATMAPGLTGVIQPVEEISRICREKGVLLHLDATYAVSKQLISFAELGADYLTISGDRLHSTKGSGGLFVKAGRPLAPLILGGVDQGGYRGGALDVPSFMAFAAAAAQAQLYLDRMGLEIAWLRDLFETEVVSKISGARIFFAEELRLPNVSAIAFPGVHAESLLYFLNRKGVFASIGGTYSPHLSRLLMGSGIDEKTALSSLSFAFSRQTTEEEIRKAISFLVEAVAYLQGVSRCL